MLSIFGAVTKTVRETFVDVRKRVMPAENKFYC